MQSTNPHVGTWKLNLAKSTYSPGFPVPKSTTLKVEVVGAGAKLISDQVQGDGSMTHYELTANYDGKDDPVTGNPNADVAALTRISPTTTELTAKKGGQVTGTITLTVSADGKTMTNTSKGVNAAGQTVTSVSVFDRQ